MAAPPQVLQWIQNTYPSPQIDPEWLTACLSWIETDLGIPAPPNGPLQPLINALESQLLESDLDDSMLHGTGLPINVNELNDVRLGGRGGILVQITAITEIASSAYALLGVMKAREERGIVGLDEANVADEDDEGPIQRYPRGMLRFELSDGSTTLNAIEYRSLPQLTLGVTPLGYKMRLKNPFIRNGIAFLEPATVDLLGGSAEDREVNQARDLARGLGIRLGIYNPEDEDADNEDGNQNLPPPPPPPPPAAVPLPQQQRQSPQAAPARMPFRDLSPPPVPGPAAHVHADDEDAPRRRKLPAPTLAPTPASMPASSSTLVQSPYFSSTSASGNTAVSMRDLAREGILSPSRADPILIPSSPSPPPEAPVPSTRPNRTKARPIAQLPARASTSKGKQNASTAPSSDFDYDFGMDDMALVMDNAAALLELDKIEGSHSASVPSSLRPIIPPASSSASGTGSTTVSGGGNARRTPAPSQIDDDDVIVIESDEEEGDKENVPVPTRHVRRRTQGRAQVVVDEDDIIDISSSD